MTKNLHVDILDRLMVKVKAGETPLAATGSALAGIVWHDLRGASWPGLWAKQVHLIYFQLGQHLSNPLCDTFSR